MNGTNGLPVDKFCHKKMKPMQDIMIGQRNFKKKQTLIHN